MGQCNAQTNRTLVSDQSTARLPRTYTTTKEEPPSHPTLRGLDLIKSCAKYYENGVGVATPTVRLSHPLGATLNHRAITQVSPSRHSKRSISVGVIGLLLLLLPSLGVATVIRGDFVSGPTKEPRLNVNGASAAVAQLPAPAITTALNLKWPTAAQTPSNEPTDIIVHKVKTQPITGEALSPNPNIR